VGGLNLFGGGGARRVGDTTTFASN